MTQPRYVCIHGHFYQPPRENPWLEAIEMQESAAPFHDWNERITAECYGPNSASRIQTNDGHIVGIINNYARMSYNFGPTLLSWVEMHSPVTYQAILEADKESIERFNGHGSAMAQVYNHIIMPLANRRDKETQILWGLRDFEYRFGRKPEGMWLSEAAVNIETLELLADHGIKFTVLAPLQAVAVRPIAANGDDLPDAGWEDVSHGRVDPTRAYYCPLPNGESIALFFYDGPISQAVAFEGILSSGEEFAQRLMSGFSDSRDFPQLLHIATDGETYGHHHTFGDMALAFALHYIEANNLARLTNYGEFLELHPPEWEVKIRNNSSWSCSHGIQRWSDDCGCCSGMHQGWTQQWRKPLRVALNWLRDEINPRFEEVASHTYRDPWRARNAYIDVILDRNRGSVETFLDKHAMAPLSPADLTKALKLMELQRQMMLMYTSCGWFFDELSGLETVQIMQYASRAIQLAEECLGIKIEDGFVQRLADAPSNIPGNKNGQVIYQKYVKPARVDLVRVGAHYAVTSLFKPDVSHEQIHAFSVERQEWDVYDTSGPSRLATGRARVRSEITYEAQAIAFAVLHLGDHNLSAGVQPADSANGFQEFSQQVSTAFGMADLPAVIRLIDHHFQGTTYSLGELFKDERQVILQEVLRNNMEQAEGMLRIIFEQNAALMRFLKSIGAPQPEILRSIGKFIVGGDLRRMLEENVTDPQEMLQVVADASAWNLTLDAHELKLSLNHAIANRTEELAMEQNEVEAMKALTAMATLAEHLPFSVNFWQAQNVIFRLNEERYLGKKASAKRGNAAAGEWVKRYVELAQHLKVKIDE